MPDARPEESQIVWREARDWLECQQNVAQHGASVAGRERESRRCDKSGLPVLGEPHPRRRRQVVRRLSPVKRRRSAHRVDDVLVETREEAKSMFAWQPVIDRTHSAAGELMSARVLAVIDDGNAPGLPPGQVAALKHDDLKAALDQFVRSAHSSDAAAEDDDPSRHVSLARSTESSDHVSKPCAKAPNSSSPYSFRPG